MEVQLTLAGISEGVYSKPDFKCRIRKGSLNVPKGSDTSHHRVSVERSSEGAAFQREARRGRSVQDPPDRGTVLFEGRLSGNPAAEAELDIVGAECARPRPGDAAPGG